jgi:hypothetical protein
MQRLILLVEKNQQVLKVIAQEKDSRFGWKLEDFLFDNILALEFSCLCY